MITLCWLHYVLLVWRDWSDLLYSTSAYNGQIKFQDSFYYLKKQVFATALGTAGDVYCGKDRLSYVAALWQCLGYITAILLSVAVMFVGDEYNGSKRWLSLGPLSFQPSEFAKVAVILFLAHADHEECQERWENMQTLVKVMLPVLPIVGLVGASNLSTAIIILGIAVVLGICGQPEVCTVSLDGMLGSRIYGSFSGTGKLSAGAYLLSGEIRKNMRKGTRRLQGLYAIGSGGLFGRGLGESVQKLGFRAGSPE